MQRAGIHDIPCNDFSLYDHVLDTIVTLGAVPERYRGVKDPLSRYFAMARGMQAPDQGIDLPALEMTKWFDTNYHYIVPELEPAQRFELDSTRLLAELSEARAVGIEPRPVLLGPVTFLLLSKLAPGAPAGAHTLDLLDELLPIYDQLLETLAEQRVDWVQLDEPCLVLDLEARAKDAYRRAFSRFARGARRPQLLLTTYFGALGDNLDLAIGGGLDGLHLDLVRAPQQLEQALAALPACMALSLGVVDGRNIWRTDLDAAHGLVRRAVSALGAERVFVGPSCSLLHVPVDLAAEGALDSELACVRGLPHCRLLAAHLCPDTGLEGSSTSRGRQREHAKKIRPFRRALQEAGRALRATLVAHDQHRIVPADRRRPRSPLCLAQGPHVDRRLPGVLAA